METIMVMVIFSLFGGCPDEMEVIRAAAARNYCDDLIILLAIRKVENGGPGKEFGVKGEAWGTNLSTQAGWAACTVRNQRQRHQTHNCGKTFLDCLADRYCPPECDSEGNVAWKINIRFWVKKIRKELKDD